MPSLRSPEAKALHDAYRRNNVDEVCPLCTKPALKAFTHWKITLNDFPYDLIAKTHHMLVSARHIVELELTEEELHELAEIKESVVSQEYDYILEPTKKEKSIPGHFHLHLIVGKDL